MKRLLIVFLLLLVAMPVIAQDDDTEFADCAFRLTGNYVWSYLWGTGQYEGTISEISNRVVAAYQALAPVATGDSAEIPYELTNVLFFNLSVQNISEADAARIYAAIYEEIGDRAIEDAPCAYAIVDEYWSFNDALGELSDTDAIIDLAVETWRTAYALTGDLACEDDPALMLTLLRLDYADTEVDIETDPALIEYVYEEVKRLLNE